MADKTQELLQGTLDMLILRTVGREPVHGYGIAQALKRTSGDVFHVQQGSLYPALHRMEERGLLKAEWRENETGRQAKFYSLTRAGRRHLEEETANWLRLSSAISRVMECEG